VPFLQVEVVGTQWNPVRGLGVPADESINWAPSWHADFEEVVVVVLVDVVPGSRWELIPDCELMPGSGMSSSGIDSQYPIMGIKEMRTGIKTLFAFIKVAPYIV